MEGHAADVPGRVGCPTPSTKLSPSEARLIIEPYFTAAKDRFVEYARERHGSGRLMKGVRMECVPWRALAEEYGFGIRNFAATSESGDLILIAPEIIELPEESVAAILAHEFGHALDSSYPADYMLVEGELVFWRGPRVGDQRIEQANIARMRQWSSRDDDTVERTADEIASHVLGQPIRYAGPCLLQTFDVGVVRPVGLR